MNQAEALELLSSTLEGIINENRDEPISIELSMESDLIEDKILIDSLDSMVFFMEIGEKSGRTIPEVDLVSQGFFTVKKLVEFITE